MKTQRIIVLSYTLLILFGGCMAYFKAHSATSLVVSGLSALILLGCAQGLKHGKIIGLYGAMAVVLALDAFFTYRFLTAFKFFPSGFMALVSLATLLGLVMSMPKVKKR